MRKPEWATKKQLRWKVVTIHRNSCVAICQRQTNCYSLDTSSKHYVRPGSILSYSPRSLVVSPNGVCTKSGHNCCFGIHAFRTKTVAKNFNSGGWIKGRIIKVYARKWHGSGYKVRAEAVYVG